MPFRTEPIVTNNEFTLSPVALSAGQESPLSDSGALPPGLYPALVQAIQSDAPSDYALVPRLGAGYGASNAAQGLGLDFGAEGVALGPGAGAPKRSSNSWSWNMASRHRGWRVMGSAIWRRSPATTTKRAGHSIAGSSWSAAANNRLCPARHQK